MEHSTITGKTRPPHVGVRSKLAKCLSSLGFALRHDPIEAGLRFALCDFPDLHAVPGWLVLRVQDRPPTRYHE